MWGYPYFWKPPSEDVTDCHVQKGNATLLHQKPDGWETFRSPDIFTENVDTAP